jgi:hypothetical protein
MRGLLTKIGKFQIKIKTPFVNQFTRCFSTDNKSDERKNVNESNQTEQEKNQPKNVKHIYKQKSSEQNPDVVYDEAHAYREGINDGYYVRQSMSYVYYEYPGKTSESGGKSEDKKEKKEETIEKDQKAQNDQTTETNKKDRENATGTNKTQ